MKRVCLDSQDCGHSEKLSKEEIKDLNINEPFTKCNLCGFYAVLSTGKNIKEIEIKTYIKVLKSLRID